MFVCVTGWRSRSRLLTIIINSYFGKAGRHFCSLHSSHPRRSLIMGGRAKRKATQSSVPALSTGKEKVGLIEGCDCDGFLRCQVTSIGCVAARAGLLLRHTNYPASRPWGRICIFLVPKPLPDGCIMRWRVWYLSLFMFALVRENWCFRLVNSFGGLSMWTVRNLSPSKAKPTGLGWTRWGGGSRKTVCEFVRMKKSNACHNRGEPECLVRFGGEEWAFGGWPCNLHWTRYRSCAQFHIRRCSLAAKMHFL